MCGTMTQYIPWFLYGAIFQSAAALAVGYLGLRYGAASPQWWGGMVATTILGVTLGFLLWP